MSASFSTGSRGFGRIAASPIGIAFGASLLLSVIALQKGVINRDGVLYVDAARVYVEQGFKASLEVFQWPFMSIMMALLAQATGMEIETAAHLLNVLFMAGTCALLVASAGRLFPEAIWPICLVVLAIPAFNEYRDELIREYGTWFFLMLAVWLSLRWSEQPNWQGAFAIQICLIMAALFRPEALAYLVAIALWRRFAITGKEGWRQLAMLSWLALLGIAALLVLHMQGDLLAGRLMSELKRFELEGFQQKSAVLASALNAHAREQAPSILVIGSLGLVPLKYVMKLGLFIVPLGFAFVAPGRAAFLARCGPFAWLFFVHVLMLAVFVLDLQFLAGRYIAPLLMFSAPVIGYGLARMLLRYPRWKTGLVSIALLVMVSNVVSMGNTKLHYVEAGRWLAKHVTDSSRVYVESGRTAYYAGWRYATTRGSIDRAQLHEALLERRYELIAMDVPRKDGGFDRWLESARMAEIRRFGNNAGDTVRIAVPIESLDTQNWRSAED